MTASVPASANAIYPAEALGKLLAPPEAEHPAVKLRRLLHEARDRGEFARLANEVAATGVAKNLPPEIEAQILRLCKRIYRTLELTGYARMDLRLKDDGRILVLEANPNPQIAKDEDFALSAKHAGIDYPDLIEQLIQYGVKYVPDRIIG